MSGIERDGEALRWTLGVPEHGVLVSLFQQLDAALDAPTDDPVVQRLFPRVLEDDDDEDRELRMLLAGDLLLQRREAIAATLRLFEQAQPRGRARVVLRLVEDEPAMLLSLLNDVRLALGARIGMTAVELRQLVDEDDVPAQQALATMDLLGWFQLQLLEHIDPAAVAHDDPDWDDTAG